MEQTNSEAVFDPDFADQNAHHLSHQEAKERDAAIKQVNLYKLCLNLHKETRYEGNVEIKMLLNQCSLESQDIFLDFHGEKVVSLKVNGEKAAIKFSQHKLYLPKENMKIDEELTISIKFENTYVTNSAGLHRFQDPEDQNIYFYTHLEPYFCNRWFPCFDQPSIRAPLALQIAVPDKDWKVFSNGNKKDNIQDLEAFIKEYEFTQPAKGALHMFEDSPPISTYLYGMDAGPFSYVKNDQEFKVPLGIGIRKSKLKYLDPREFFRLMEAGILFYEDFFGTKFPWVKYENIFCPEFRIRGMENVGMINMTDKYFRPKIELTELSRFEYLKVCVHELSHMWFGNLVTMKWWNDLWLKESFADYCAGVCLTALSTKFKKVVKNPEQAFLHFLTEAINEDVLETTHPIQVTVNDTNDAANVFDKICYRKGACFVRQIGVFVGEDVLKEGMKMYFEKYALQNTELADFMACFQEAASKKQLDVDLDKWMQSWLMTSGINTLTPVVNYVDGKYSIDIIQGKSLVGDKDVLREQMIDVAVLKIEKIAGVTADEIDEDGDIELKNKVLVGQTLENCLIDDSGKKTDAMTCDEEPWAVLVNYRNKGYARIRFDSKSQENLVRDLRYVTNIADRTYIWRTFVDMVANNELNLADWYKVIINNLRFELEEQTIAIVFAQLLKTIKNGLFTEEQTTIIFNMVSKMELSVDEYSQFSKGALISQFCAEIVAKGIIIPPEAMTCEACYEVISYQCKSKDQMYTFLRLMFANPDVTAVPMANRKKFLSALQKMDKKGVADLDTILDSQGGFTQQAADRHLNDFGPYSDQDSLLEHGCFASIADWEHKKTLFTKMLQQDGFGVKTLEEAGKWIYNSLSLTQQENLAELYFDYLENVFKTLHRDYAEMVLTKLSPVFLGRTKDLTSFQNILTTVGGSNTHFANLLKGEIHSLSILIEQRKQVMDEQKSKLKQV